MEPILKWAGGKRQLLAEITRIIPKERLIDHSFFEPFVGGGSVFLHYEHSKAVVNDYNSELMNIYCVIRDEPLELIKQLREHKEKHCREYYYSVREWDRTKEYTYRTNVEKAGRIVYLNRTCFNGLYRVNAQGFFNVPMGRYVNPDIVPEERILAMSRYLNEAKVTLMCGDFADAVIEAKEGDVVYFDPPYDYETDGFTAYTAGDFSRDDLIRLKNLCDDLIDRGCTILVSNNETDFVKEIFNGPKYICKTVLAKRMINCNGKRRNEVKEVLIYG